MCSCGKPSPERSRSSAEIGKSAHRNSLSKTRVFERTAHRAALLPNLVVACSPILGSGLPGRRARRRPGPVSQELTTATASISIMKSGPARRVTPTVVLVGVATPR